MFSGLGDVHNDIHKGIAVYNDPGLLDDPRYGGKGGATVVTVAPTRPPVNHGHHGKRSIEEQSESAKNSPYVVVDEKGNDPKYVYDNIAAVLV